MNIEFNRVTWYSKFLAVIVLLTVFAGGFYLGTRKDEVRILFPKDEGVACTMEAKLCPDGSAVGRTGPNCEFAECPKTPRNKENLGNDAGAIDIPRDIVMPIIEARNGVCRPLFSVPKAPELTAEEAYSQECFDQTSKKNCLSIDIYNGKNNTFGSSDGVSDCKWEELQ